jgi:hypothetical protein
MPGVSCSPATGSSTAVKLCKDCTHYRPVLLRKHGSCTVCGDVDLVTGRIADSPAAPARVGGRCGPDGLLFQAGPAHTPSLLSVEDVACVREACTLAAIAMASTMAMVAIVVCLVRLSASLP